MKNISIIACVGKKLELGYKNDLIWHLPSDLKYFKKMTNGKTVVMGRKTFNSITKALPNRRNIVLQRKEEIIKGVEVFHDIQSVLEATRNDDVFIIGGASIYREFLEYADKVYLTEVNEEYPLADVYFPKINYDLYDKEIIGYNEENGLKYQYVLYTRR